MAPQPTKLKMDKTNQNTTNTPPIIDINNSFKFHYQNIFETFDSSEQGLDGNEAAYRLKKYGLNQITGKPNHPIWLELLHQFTDPLTLLLIAATLIAFFTGNSTDAWIILVVIALNSTISFFQTYKAEKAIEALRKIISPQARVYRNKQQILVDTAKIVPGDVIILNEGDTIPADAIVFHSNELETSEAILTGESYPISKLPYNAYEKGNLTEIENIIFTGTTISRGNAKALVIKTGMASEFGKIANLTQETTHDQTPLEKEIHQIGVFAAKITLTIVAIIFAYEYIFHQRSLIDTILFAASIAVAAVPEGLPAVITIAMAVSVQKLSQKNAIIRQLSSIETLGCTSVICTDKTGTLTKNEMTVTDVLIDDFFIKFQGVGYAPQGKFQIYTANNETIELDQINLDSEFGRHNPGITASIRWLSLCASLCNNSAIQHKDGNYSILGDPTEGSILVMARKLHADPVHNEDMVEIHELPFDSDRKIMTKIFQDKRHNKFYVFSKGAPDQLIPQCDQRLYHGKTTILTKGVKEEMLSMNEKFNEDALRTIALAYKEITAAQLQEILDMTDFKEKINILEKKLVYIGIAGMMDPPREDVAESIRLTKIAGIKTYIVTGDHGFTTAAIAKQIGLISDQHPYEIITGDQLDNMPDEEIQHKFTNKHLDLIFARSKPEHKLRIVSLLKANGEIVAVTGDGVNDAPALKRADIGIAMGISGSDVSKEAANIVLMDDSYSTIVTAIREGRVIFSNLKKFIYYIFSSNIAEVMTIFFCLLAGLGSPLTAALILTINFVTDLFPALALAAEPAGKHIMENPPRSKDEKILKPSFIRKILITGLEISIVMVGLYAYKLFTGGWIYGQSIPVELANQAASISFVAMVVIQITNSFNAKTEHESVFRINPLNNLKLIFANIFSILIAVAVVEFAPLQAFFHTAGLSPIDWAMVISSCLLITLLIELNKYLSRKKHKLNA